MRLLHCADIHLGRQPYQLDERFEDFGRAFRHIAHRALELRADTLLIGGDLFDKRNINAATLAQATQTLDLLRGAGVPVVAIEGNHDKAFQQDRFSWMEYLSWSGYLRLLKGDVEADPVLPEWRSDTKRGTWTDIGNVRIYGFRWFGVATDEYLQAILPLLSDQPERFTVFLLHAGVGTPEPGMALGSVSWETLSLFQGRAHLFALGHWHRKLLWERPGTPLLLALMPGSSEICEIGEAGYDHGFFVIDVPDGGDSPPTVTFEPTPYRAHYRKRIAVDGCESPDAVVQRAQDTLEWDVLRAMEQPVVQVVFEGRLPFDPLEIRAEDARAAIQSVHPCLVIEVVNNANLPSSVLRGDATPEGRESLERETLRELIGESAEYAPYADSLVETVSRWKEIALSEDRSSDFTNDILDLLRRSVEEIEKRPPEPVIAEPVSTAESNRKRSSSRKRSSDTTPSLPGFERV